MHPNCMNRGVEAKANNGLDEDSEVPSRSLPPTDLSSASYVQVVVQKQRRGPCRSPSRLDGAPSAVQQMTQATEGETGARLAAAAAHCPGLRALLQLQPGARAVGHDPPSRRGPIRAKNTDSGVWKKLGDVAAGKETSCGVDGPARVALFRLERGAVLSAVRSWDPAGRGSRVERLARQLAAPAVDLLDELLALLRILFTLPVHVVLRVGRCTLSTSVWAASGALQAVADEVLTPTLALSFNTLARPPLVLATHFALALRDAMRPLWLAFADALEPLSRVLTGFRLVHVERACHRPQLHHV
ncbi:uncharacterized protein LOC110995675 isoform X1 [Pieris rapae]|uniref:uncharacterized protein LOC110995675 isoform X1 n=1 Tax=Pieris rapae TaxID=64459 RepID=UPI000B926CA8|nr:uncharacterized protein LOC110995675 isoform X1 [Pieris rapae]